VPHEDESPKSGFWVFWSSLAGILTGVAAVLAAAGTLIALFVGDEGSESPRPAAAVRTESPAAPGADGDDCFASYFDGIPGDRRAPVEAGTTNFDVIGATQPKAGTIGITFTAGGRPIGAIRFAYFPDNRLFKIESVVDAQCSPVDDYENVAGGDKQALNDSGTVRLPLGGGFYDFTTIAWGSTIRVQFVPVAP